MLLLNFVLAEAQFMKSIEDYHNQLPYRKTNDDNFGNILLKMIEHYGLKSKFNEVRIKNYWKEQMGLTVADYTNNIYVKNNTLYIHISAAGLRQELSYAKSKILKMMNEYLGEDFVHEVIIL
jgi:hypothetical protein